MCMMDWGPTAMAAGQGGWNDSATPNVTAVRGNLYRIYQLIEFGKYYALIALCPFHSGFNIYSAFSLSRALLMRRVKMPVPPSGAKTHN